MTSDLGVSDTENSIGTEHRNKHYIFNYMGVTALTGRDGLESNNMECHLFDCDLSRHKAPDNKIIWLCVCLHFAFSRVETVHRVQSAYLRLCVVLQNVCLWAVSFWEVSTHTQQPVESQGGQSSLAVCLHQWKHPVALLPIWKSKCWRAYYTLTVSPDWCGYVF